eukprot:COSAG01_NODE_24824_length_765_cov_0.788288_2_plen_73_part_01
MRGATGHKDLPRATGHLSTICQYILNWESVLWNLRSKAKKLDARNAPKSYDPATSSYAERRGHFNLSTFLLES